LSVAIFPTDLTVAGDQAGAGLISTGSLFDSTRKYFKVAVTNGRGDASPELGGSPTRSP
jgi:hypothetical protein